MDAGNEKIQEELREVQKEVEDAEEKVGSHSPNSARRLEDAEEGTANIIADRPSSSSSGSGGSRLLTRGESPSSHKAQQQSVKTGLVNLVQLFVNPILLQTFIMTFLAEWGDRSQISTIALAAAHVSSRECSSITFLIVDRDLLPTECLYRIIRHCSRSPVLHSCRCNGRTLARNQDISQTCHSRWCCPFPHLWRSLCIRGEAVIKTCFAVCFHGMTD